METMATLAGSFSTILFISSNVPMLLKAVRTKDMHSYSQSNIILSNVGNAVYWFYVASLPPGPIWLLHSFYTVASIFLLLLFLRYK